MARILSDSELKKLIGKVIIDGDEHSLRPNSYVVRLGSEGRFLSTGTRFKLSQGQAVKIRPGETVAITSLETLDLKQGTVDEIYKGKQLHGFLSPTTDLSREGIVAPSTQVDAGFEGTLNWTLVNMSVADIPFMLGAGVYRLTLFLLDGNEIPSKLYEGYYQGKTGFVPSQRPNLPMGFDDADFVTSDLPEDVSDALAKLQKSTYPWNIIGMAFKNVEGQTIAMSGGYQDIKHALTELQRRLEAFEDRTSKSITEEIQRVFGAESSKLILRFLGSILVLAGLGLSLLGAPESVQGFLRSFGWILGLLILAVGFLALVLPSRK